METFLAMKVQSSSISMKEHVFVMGWLAGNYPVARKSQRETIL